MDELNVPFLGAPFKRPTSARSLTNDSTVMRSPSHRNHHHHHHRPCSPNQRRRMRRMERKQTIMRMETK